MLTAYPLFGGVKIAVAEMLPNGVHVLAVDYDGTYDDFKAKPTRLYYQGRVYGKASHDSDSFKVCYRTDATLYATTTP